MLTVLRELTAKTMLGEIKMMYVDYVLDIEEGYIGLDSDLKLCNQSNEQGWGNLPKNWKVGDTFKLAVSETGKVFLQKQPNAC
jgi:hypothetical protein